MKITLHEKEYDLNALTNIYDSVLVNDGDGGVTAISTQFYELNSDKLEKQGYCLNFMFGSQRVDVNFKTKRELEDYSNEIITLLQSK